MSLTALFANRQINICYWDSNAKFASRDKAHFEYQLKKIGDVRLTDATSPEVAVSKGADLLVIADPKVDGDAFIKWMDQFAQRMSSKSTIWLPALIMSSVPFEVLGSILTKTVYQNWYFDIVHPDHLDSLPIRVANLLRIHDHLKELHRYDQQLSELSAQVEALEKKIK
jgi:hypothetical protein